MEDGCWVKVIVLIDDEIEMLSKEMDVFKLYILDVLDFEECFRIELKWVE